jgi:predicted nucleic acid-binding protein
MTIIVDASVAIKWIVHEDALNARALALRDSEERIEAPDLILSEVLNVAWKKWRRREMTAEEATIGFTGILNFLDIIHPAENLYRRAMALAFELDHSAYDCIYLACAEQIESVLVTADRRLCDSANRAGLGHLVRSLSDVSL